MKNPPRLSVILGMALMLAVAVGMFIAAVVDGRGGDDSSSPAPTAKGYATVSAEPSATPTLIMPSSDVTPSMPDPSTMEEDWDVPSGGPTGKDATGPAVPVATSDQSRADAAKVAVRALTLFARPAVDASTWRKELSPLLTADARTAYGSMDPSVLPVSKVTGKPRLVPQSGGLAARFLIGTNDGDYAVVLVREGDTAPWQVSRFVPPASDDMGR